MGGDEKTSGGADGSDRGAGARPSNQSRAGWNHSITIAATTTAETMPPLTSPLTNSGAASADSATRAPFDRCSTW